MQQNSMVLGSRRRQGDQHKLRVKILRYLFCFWMSYGKILYKEMLTEEKLNKTQYRKFRDDEFQTCQVVCCVIKNTLNFESEERKFIFSPEIFEE